MHSDTRSAADSGLPLAELAERAALAHLWALRVLVLMDTTGCSAAFAIRAVAAADTTEEPTFTAPLRGAHNHKEAAR